MDVDECLENSSNCHANAICQNLLGAFSCQCSSGYTGDGVAACIDQDECLLGSHDCHDNAQCENLPGAYECRCLIGFQGNGTDCVDLNECRSSAHNCDDNAGLCANNIGSFR